MREKVCRYVCFFFFFNDTATTEIYTLSLDDALPISRAHERPRFFRRQCVWNCRQRFRPRDHVFGITARAEADRKSTRLNSSHSQISYAVFCLKKKKRHLSASKSEHPSRKFDARAIVS